MTPTAIKPDSINNRRRELRDSSARGPWRPIWLLAAPHRLAFFMAALMMAISSIWWATVLITQALNINLPWTVPVSAAHALLMTMGFMPLFFTGFLFTAGPKWLGLPPVSARSLLPGLTAILCGLIFALIGFHAHTLVASAGLALVAVGWTTLSLKFAALLRKSQTPDRAHLKAVVVASGVGVITLWLAGISLAFSSILTLRIATQLGLWGFIAPIFAVVSHRMIPFFGTRAVPVLDAWRPMWLLWLMVSMLWLEAALNAADLLYSLWPAVMRWGQVAVELTFSLLMLWLAVRWSLVQSLKIRLIAMLHGGFTWLGISFLLNAISHALMALTENQHSLGLAPLHAMTMGYLGATLFAMTTRVSSGHGGRPVAADSLAWALYWILQTAVLLRVLAAIWTAINPALTLLAILVWTIATVGWAVRYGSWFGRPRVDGRPG